MQGKPINQLRLYQEKECNYQKPGLLSIFDWKHQRYKDFVWHKETTRSIDYVGETLTPFKVVRPGL
jgi:hypothetical protein